MLVRRAGSKSYTSCRIHRREINCAGCNQFRFRNELPGEVGSAVLSNEERLKGLLVLGLAGDASAYEACLRELSGHLRRFLRKRLARLPDDVEDLLQETLFAVHNQRHTYDTNQPLTAWLHAIARYKLIDFLRRRSRGDALNDPLDDSSELLAAADSDASEARRDLGVLLAQLPAGQRLPIVHTKIEGLSVAETARLTGMSESAVKVGVHRGMKALAARLKESG
ncbi:MAG: sigma-70 family RNA polymerase sigma factor [Betaproteobacteria bacterium]|nr:sigma-70 family RNA polymerase sigma factor [Betaproteobacteria bacterium]